MSNQFFSITTNITIVIHHDWIAISILCTKLHTDLCSHLRTRNHHQNGSAMSRIFAHIKLSIDSHVFKMLMTYILVTSATLHYFTSCLQPLTPFSPLEPHLGPLAAHEAFSQLLKMMQQNLNNHTKTLCASLLKSSGCKSTTSVNPNQQKEFN